MYFIVVKFPVKPEWSDRWLDLVDTFTQATRNEPGNLFFEWSRSVEDRTSSCWSRRFTDDGAGPHVNSDHFKQAMAGPAAGPGRDAEDRQPAGRRRAVGTRWARCRSTEHADRRKGSSLDGVDVRGLDHLLAGTGTVLLRPAQRGRGGRHRTGGQPAHVRVGLHPGPGHDRRHRVRHSRCSPRTVAILLPVKVAIRRAEGIDEGDVVTVRMSVAASMRRSQPRHLDRDQVGDHRRRWLRQDGGMTETLCASSAYRVDSEVGRLRKVLVCAPGLAHERLTPTNCDDLLFDDVLWVEKANSDHAAFMASMRDRGVEVVELHEVLAETLARRTGGPGCWIGGSRPTRSASGWSPTPAPSSTRWPRSSWPGI